MEELCIRISTDDKVTVLPSNQNVDIAQKINATFTDVVRCLLFPEPFRLICDDSGLVNGKPMNRIASFYYGTLLHGNVIAGDVLIMKVGMRNGEPDILGLSREEAQYILYEMKQNFGVVVPEWIA